MHAVEVLASQNACLDPVQRSESMKLAAAELAVLKEENRLQSQSIRCYELEAELGQQRIVEAQARELKRQRTAIKSGEVPTAYQRFCAASIDGVRQQLQSQDSSVSGRELGRMVKQCLAQQWAGMTLEEKDAFGDGVPKQCMADSTNFSPPSFVDLSEVSCASSSVAADGGLFVADVDDVSVAAVDVVPVASFDAASVEFFLLQLCLCRVLCRVACLQMACAVVVL